jgi:thaumarchaeosortase
MNKKWFHITLLVCITLPIVLLCFLDYYNLEGYNYRFNPQTNSFENWNNKYFNQTFSFDVTWKGRMFYLFFAWFLILETAIGWQKIVDKRLTKRSLIIASLACALIPTVYVLATNFLGLDLAILKIGHSIGVPSVYSNNDPSDFLHLQWPLSVEYLVFFIFFLAAILIAYRPRGLKIFSISYALLGAMAVAYMLDTIYPFGVFRPLQEMALPTAATAAALFDLLGYRVMLSYPVHTGDSLMPGLAVGMGDKGTSVAISWACAGVYSLLLYVLIILLFFKRTNISGFRKLFYFVIGLFGTFFANVLRIYAIVIINLQQGHDAGMIFHNTYGELFGFTWIFAFIILVVCIERFMLVERTREEFRKIVGYLGASKSRLEAKLRTFKIRPQSE